MALYGRGRECAALDELVKNARGGRSGVLQLVGDAGIGKTALLDHAVTAAAGLRVMRVTGAEAEQELPFAALHQLCGPLLDHLDRLPEPQADALRTTFGLSAAPAPDPLFVGLATLTLISGAASERPLLCVVDDTQWIDRASAQTLAFVARRLFADPVAMIFAARQPLPELSKLPLLPVAGLRDGDARDLLGAAVRWPLDEQVRDAVLAEARGNPLALLELPRSLSPAELAGGFNLPRTDRLEESFLRRLDGLSAGARLLALVAAADPVGDPTMLWRAAGALDLDWTAGQEVEGTGLLQIGNPVVFRHTLVRSAVYDAATPDDRRRVHRVLAGESTDPDRRAWHRAQAVAGPDESVAAELERSADRAQARGGLAAAAAFLERAASLSTDPDRRADRELAAAQAKFRAGARDAALTLLARAESGPADDLRAARVMVLRGQLAFASPHSADAPRLLIAAAERFDDVRLARDTYLDALAAGIYVGRFAAGEGLAGLAKNAPPAPEPPRPADLLLDALTALFADGPAAGVPLARAALDAFRDGEPDAVRWLFVAGHCAHDVWDDESWHVLSARCVGAAREMGALGVLPVALSQRVALLLHEGRFESAARLVDEIDVISEATDGSLPAYAAFVVAAWQGRDDVDVEELIDGVRSRGEGMGLTLLHHTAALGANGLGRFPQALAHARLATANPAETGVANWALTELIEAAVRVGESDEARQALRRLVRTTAPSGTEWGLGIEARCRALVAGDGAEDLFEEAIERLGRSRGAVALARAHLLFGEWLLGQGRDADAHPRLRTALEMFTGFGAQAFAARTRNALGDAPARVVPSAPMDLTPQEQRIARRARDGLSNAEIGAELFLSARTVEWHLRKVFTKLGVAGRRQLPYALGDRAG